VTSFLLVHGWQNRRPPGHWQHWLALRLKHHQVLYPQLPHPDHPDPAAWVRELAVQLARMRHTRRVVICHSLGCMAWLQLAAAGPRALGHVVDHLLFVAPPSPEFLAAQPELAAFRADWPIGPLLRATCRTQPRLVCSDNDIHCVRGAHHAYPDTFDVDVLPGAGHLDIPAGYGAWPSLLAWCADPARRITANGTLNRKLVLPGGANGRACPSLRRW